MIRSLTVGLPLEAQSTSEIVEGVRHLLEAAQAHLSAAGHPPRTVRYTLPPIGAEGESEGVVFSRLRWVDDLARATGARWFCVPLDFLCDAPRRGRLAAALDAINRFERMFLNAIVSDRGRIALNAAADVARFVLDVSRKSNNGFDNFRVGASCNCPPNAPFFPFSRHEGPTLAFSLALETTPLAKAAIEGGGHPPEVADARDRIAAALAPHLRAIDECAREIARVSGAEYRGLDASLAPFPADQVSVAELVQTLIGAPVGSHGSVLATAFLTDAVRSALSASGARAAGFNGVMYSVLEDAGLAAANNRRGIDLDTLLVLSSVCACGLDMVPVPGISFPEEIGALILDVAALSCALGKPLGVRLLPIPNANLNEFTRFNLDFLCDSRVLGLTANDRHITSGEALVGLRSPRH